MKLRCFLITTLFLIVAGTAPAQTDWSSPKLTVDVPFDFVVNGTTLPAGTYLVRTHGTAYALMIQNRDDGEYSTFVINNDIKLSPFSTHDRSTFVFSLNNGQHVLHQVKIAGDNHTHDIVHGNNVPELVGE